MVTGPGGTGARKIALAVTSLNSGRPRASRIARSAVYIETPPNTYTTFQLSGMSAWKRRGIVGSAVSAVSSMRLRGPSDIGSA